MCFGKTFVNIDEALATALEIKTRLGQLGETPCDPLSDEVDDSAQFKNKETKRHIMHFS